jgi:acetyl esterase
LHDSTSTAISARGADLEPEIRQFIATTGAAYASFPDFNNLPLPEMRRACEQVRAPWAAGGPVMAERVEHTVPSPVGTVRVRIHNPSSRAEKPALLYMHGGGWTTFSIDTHDRLMREYAARADIVVIGVDYALSPEVKFPVAQQQIASVVRWVREDSEELGIHRDRIALGGDSAGGNLAITTALRLRDEGDADAVHAVVTNYAVTDIYSTPEALQRYGYEGYMLAAEEMPRYWDNYLHSRDEATNPLVCPVLADLRGLPPVFMVIPECDILTEQNWRLAEQLKQAGVKVTPSFYKGASHSFLEAMSISALSNRAIDDTARWLKETLEPR